MRLTNDIRHNIKMKIMANVPVLDYENLLVDVVQDQIVKHMDPNVLKVYRNEETRHLLVSAECRIYFESENNRGIYTKSKNIHGYTSSHRHHGLSENLKINLDPRVMGHIKPGSLYYDVLHAVHESGYAHKHFEQNDLLNDVRRRVENTLNSVGTVKRLYDVLEPELHHLIPKETDKTANVPALAAPFVADLKRLGAELPEVPKAKEVT